MVRHSRPNHETRPFPLLRRLVIDASALGARRHTVYGLIEVDVTRPRQLIRRFEQLTGEKLSFTGYLVHCLATAVARHRSVQAYRYRRRIVEFDDVDVVVITETPSGGGTFPAAQIVRAADKRSLPEIQSAVRGMQASGGAGSAGGWRFMRWFLRLPGPVRRLAYRLALANPFRVKQYIGTVSLSAVGMFGGGGGWGIALPQHTLQVVVGGIAGKPVLVDGSIESREILNLTIAVDHDVVDGAPAARFGAEFRSLVESAHGVDALVAAAGGAPDERE